MMICLFILFIFDLFSYGRFVGVGARRVRSLFQAAKKKVCFFEAFFADSSVRSHAKIKTKSY